MKNSTLIKWAAGLSGAVMFTGFVGYISQENDEDFAQSPVQNDDSGQTFGSSDDSVSKDPSDRDGFISQWGGRHSFGGSSDIDDDRGGASSGSSSSDDSAATQGSSGRLHTRGS